MTTPLQLPADALLEQLHQVSKRRSYVYAAANEAMREAAKNWADIWELDTREQELLTALSTLGHEVQADDEGEDA